MPFWVALLVNVALAGLSALLQAGKSKIKAQPLGVPDTQPGDAVPIFWGIVKVPLRPVEFAGFRTTDINEGPRPFFNVIGARATKGHRYHVKMTTLIGLGPIERLRDIFVDNKSILAVTGGREVTGMSGWTVVYSAIEAISGIDGANASFMQFDGELGMTINVPNMLGGTDANGGVRGDIVYRHGAGHSTVVDALEARVPGLYAPHWGHYAYIVWEDVWIGNSPILPPLHVEVQRAPVSPLPHGLVGVSGVLDPGYGSDAQGDANGAGIIWEILTNPQHGLGLPHHMLDEDRFGSAALTMRGYDTPEGSMGLSFVVDAATPARELLLDVLRTIDASLYTNPVTGLIGLWLHRDASYTLFEYDDRSNVIDPDNALSLKWTTPLPAAQVTEVRVNFTNRDKEFQQDSVTVEHTALANALGQRITQEVEFLGVSTEGMARRLAHRELRALTIPLGRATLKCDRMPCMLWPGRQFNLDWPEYGIDSVVMRVVDIDYGTLADPTITIEAIQDAYAQPPVAGTRYTSSDPWVDPTPAGGVQVPDVDAFVEPGASTGDAIIVVINPGNYLITVKARRVGDDGSLPSWTLLEEEPYILTVDLNGERETTVLYEVTWEHPVSGATNTIEGGVVFPRGLFPSRPTIVMERYLLDGGDEELGPFEWHARMFVTDNVTTKVYAYPGETVYDSAEQLRDLCILHSHPDFVTILFMDTVFDEAGTRQTLGWPDPSLPFSANQTVRYRVAAVCEDAAGNLGPVAYSDGTNIPPEIAPGAAPYLVTEETLELSASRRLLAGTGLQAVDGGAGGDFTVSLDAGIADIDGLTAALADKLEVGDLDALAAVVAGKSDVGHTHAATDITTGTLADARLSNAIRDAQLVFVFNNGSSNLSDSMFIDLPLPFACTIYDWQIDGAPSGSVSFDLWRTNAAATAAPAITDTIVAAAYPTLTTAIKATSATLTGWSTALAAKDTVRAVVRTGATLTQATLTVRVRR